jgi:hypothetical protein
MKVERESCPICEHEYGFIRCKISGGGKPTMCLLCAVDADKPPVDNYEEQVKLVL